LSTAPENRSSVVLFGAENNSLQLRPLSAVNRAGGARIARGSRSAPTGRDLLLNGRFAERSIIRADLYLTKITSMLPDVTSSDVQPTFGGDADVRIPVSARVEIGPSFRMRWVRRADEGLGAYGGVSSYAYHFGAILRFKL
jgi:hypothetical protein